MTTALPPGPTWPRAVQTAAWVARTGPWLHRLHRRYGDAFTITIGHEPHWVILADPEAVREVFTGDPEVFHAGEGNEILRPVLGSRSVLLLDEKPHMQARKRLLPPFHGERMKAWRRVMEEVAEREVGSWPREAPVQLLPRAQALTLEVILRTVFGSEDPGLRDGLRDAMDNMSSPIGMALLAILGPQRIVDNRLFRNQIDPLDALLASHLAERRAAPDLTEREDVLSLLLAAGMSDEELRDELMTLLVAGHETTATGLAWAVERLVRHPEAWAALREGDEEWADAVVKETLRLRPVLPVVVRKLTRDATVAGMDLPAGSVVAPCIWLIHRRADVYEDPHAFRPERFLGVKPGTYTWIPFGGGVRRCIGAAFAELELRVVLQAVARAVDVRAARPEPESVRRRTITLTPSRGAEIVISNGNRSAPAGVRVDEELTV